MADPIYRHRPTHCPHCGRASTAAGGAPAEDGPPQSGDFAICWGCDRVGVYLVSPLGISVRTATAEEEAECLADNAELIAAKRRFTLRNR